MDWVRLMGINSGRFKGVGQRRVTAPTFLNNVTVKPAAGLSSVWGVLMKASADPRSNLTAIWNIFDNTGALRVTIPNAGGLKVAASQLAAGTVANGFMGFDGTTTPASIKAPNGTRIYLGVGAMTHGNYPNVNGNVGDLNWSLGSAGSKIMQRCTVAGNPGTWVTIAS
jgi:hypothetical protein